MYVEQLFGVRCVSRINPRNKVQRMNFNKTAHMRILCDLQITSLHLHKEPSYYVCDVQLVCNAHSTLHRKSN